MWVFNPHNPRDGICHHVIRSEGEIDVLITRIDRDVRAATRYEA